MLPTRLQMLPLLWLLLWMPKPEHCSTPIPENVTNSPVNEDMSTLYNGTRDGVGNETTTEEPEEIVKETTTAEPKAVGNDTTTAEPEEEAEYYPTEVDKVLMVGTRNGEQGDLEAPMTGDMGRNCSQMKRAGGRVIPTSTENH